MLAFCVTIVQQLLTIVNARLQDSGVGGAAEEVAVHQPGAKLLQKQVRCMQHLMLLPGLLAAMRWAATTFAPDTVHDC